MIKFRIPNSPDIQTRFFGQFTAKDIARIGIPVLIGYLTTPIGLAGSVVAGLVIGFVLYRVTVHGKHLDEFTADTVTWAWKVHRNATVDFRQNPEKHGVRTEDGDVLTGHLLVYPVNLSLQNQDEQAALHRRLQDVLETVSYPVKLHIIQDTRSLTQGTIIENNDFDADQLYNAAASYVDTYAESADGHNIAVPVISVPVKKHTGGVWGSLFPWRSGTRTETEQQRILFRRLQEIENALDTAKLETARINWSNFDTAINNKYQDTTPEPFYTDTRGPWMKTVVIEEYPDTVELGWTAEIARCDGEVDITQIVEPADPGTTVKALNRAVEQLSAEISSWINAGYLGTTDLESRLEDAEWMLERFTAGEDLPVKYKAYITARGDTKAACDRVMDQVTTQLDMRQFEYRVPVAETFTVQQTIAPHTGIEEADTDVMPSSSAAAGFPFGTRPFPKSGVVVGEDSRDEAPVLLDRFSWKAPHTVKLGATGSGKSYGTKLELLRSAYFYEDARFIVVDPKKEYRGLVKQIGGHVYEIGSDADRDDIISLAAADDDDPRFLSFEPKNRTGTDTTDVLIDIVQALYQATSQDDTRTIVVVDESHRLLTDGEGKQILSQFVREARDTNTGVTLLSQNASDFTATTEGRALLDNVETIFLMQHERVPDSVIDYFDLSQREAQELYSLKTGTDCEYSEAIVKVSDRRNTKVRITASDQEHDLITGATREVVQ